jgi:hypothetical protein
VLNIWGKVERRSAFSACPNCCRPKYFNDTTDILLISLAFNSILLDKEATELASEPLCVALFDVLPMS